MIRSHSSALQGARADLRVRRALLSVFDKRGLVDVARCLRDLDIEILSTGGTASMIRDEQIPVTPIESVTGFPEILDGRVKTLHPAVHAGILYQRAVLEHRTEVERLAIQGIDLVLVNLYPFADARGRGAELPELLEYIDIGGPAMVRAAAKNFPYVAVVTDPSQYEPLLAELRERQGALCGTTRARLAQAAFARLSHYDGEVAAALDELARRESGDTAAADQASAADATASAPVRSTTERPEQLSIHVPRVRELRYGENPHQRAAFYAGDAARSGLPGARVLQGKALSYNNLLDVDAVLNGVREMGRSSCVIVKHASPCGIARGAGQLAAFRAARDADPLSAFGGVIGFAEPLTADTAVEIAGDFYEVVLAPGIAADAQAALARKKNLRVLEVAPELLQRSAGWVARAAIGGFLLQEVDACAGHLTAPGNAVPARSGDAPSDGEEDEILAASVVSERVPSGEELQALAFAWRCARLVRSNAIVLTREDRTVGIGGGQASRIDAVEVAAMKAARCGHDTRGTVLASDAFFPFRDCVDRAADLGVTAIAQPGGSRRDPESIDAANQHGIAMVFTGRRHFLH